jgi:chorismate dehydratase
VWGFSHGPLKGRYDLSYTVPSLCAEALRNGDADVAIIPAVEYQRMDGMVMLPDMAVAAKRDVRSILVLAKKPIESAKRIALDTDSRSSVALTRLLCQGFWGISPKFVDAAPDPAAMLADADAALLIGDPALRVRFLVDRLAAKAPSGNPCTGDSSESPIIEGVDTLYIYDVAEQWQQMTGKPCVLATWVGREDIISPQVVSDFLESKEYGCAHIGEIAEAATLELDLPPSYLESYLRDHINFSLDEDNLEGLRHYFSLCAEAKLIPANRPIKFAAIGARAGSSQGRI